MMSLALSLLSLGSVRGLLVGHGAARPAVRSSLRMADEQLYCLNVRLNIKPERREEFLAAIEANRAGTLSAEPLAVTYLFGEDDMIPNSFEFFDNYDVCMCCDDDVIPVGSIVACFEPGQQYPSVLGTVAFVGRTKLPKINGKEHPDGEFGDVFVVGL